MLQKLWRAILSHVPITVHTEGDFAALVKRYGAPHIFMAVVAEDNRYSIRWETELSTGRELFCLLPGAFLHRKEVYDYVSYHADWLQATLGPASEVFVVVRGRVYHASQQLQQPA